MPGLVGVVERPGRGRIEPLFGALIAPFRTKGLSVDAVAKPKQGWALGRGHLGILQPERQPAGDHSVHVLFHGDLHNELELREELAHAGIYPAPGAAHTVEAIYRLVGEGAVSRLEGAFCAVILDERTRRLILVTDLLGSYPLYWYHNANHFVFASELKALLRCPDAPRSLSARSLADYLAFGFVLGDKTLADGVRLVPPGTMLTYSWQEGSVAVHRHRSVVDAFSHWEGTKEAYFDRVCHAFNEAVDRSLRGAYRYGLSLSGGLDSRTILSALNRDSTLPGTYTLGVRGCADQVIATKLAALAGTAHRFFELDDRYLREFLPNLRSMVSLTDGMYLSHGLTEMLALGFLRESGYSVLLRGHAGEVAKTSLAWPLHTDERVKAMRSATELAPYLMTRNYLSARVSLHELLTDDCYAGVNGGARRSLEESTQNVNLSPPDLCSYLYLIEHHRRYTIASLEIFRSAVEVRMPFADERFLRALLAGPADWREGTEIHRAIVQRNSPRLLRVRNSNTGAPAGAGRLTEAIADRFNSVFKRLNLYGYRHYHAFDEWMKRMLLDSVERVLLHPDCLRRGIFREATLRRLIDETRTGAADHGYLFQVMLLVELWQQDTTSGPASELPASGASGHWLHA